MLAAPKIERSDAADNTVRMSQTELNAAPTRRPTDDGGGQPWSRRIGHRFALALLVFMSLVTAACSSNESSSNGGMDDTTSSTVGAEHSLPDAEDLSNQELSSTTVFVSGEDGYATYRIPAIVETTDGTLIAFAEGRVSTAADDGDVDLLAKRSDDGGKTWGDLQIVADMGPNFIGNPSPVVDEATGRVVLLATYKAGTDTEFDIMVGHGIDTSREFLLTSDDNGVTWSEPLQITESVKAPEWQWYSVGPGHAFQIESGPHAGRLVAAANHSDDEFNYGAHLLLSDDGGLTWRIGASETPKKGPRHPNESTAAMLDDGRIVVSARDQDGDDQWHRLRTTSTDGGETFASPFEEQTGLVIPVVQVSMLAIAGTDGSDDATTLLLSGPSDSEKRIDLRVRTSTDAGVTWSEGSLVGPGPAAYSDLIGLTDGLIGVLFETGDNDATERIDFATFGVNLLD